MAMRQIPSRFSDRDIHNLPTSASLDFELARRTLRVLESGERIDGYIVLEVLGRSWQGQVYRALDLDLQREVLIKLGVNARTADERYARRVVREGRILAALDHPGLPRVHEVGVFEDRPFLVLEYVPGSDLFQLAEDCGVSRWQAAGILAQAARALDYAHRKGVLHRDIKPQNVIVDPRGRARLIDFGMARARFVREELPQPRIVGTASFMAPEQARGELPKTGPCSDLFSLGATLYFLLTRRLPYDGETFEEILDKAREADFDRAPLEIGDVPRRLAAVCLKAMAREPDARHASAAELAAALDAFARRRWSRLSAWAGGRLSKAAALA
jgi:serine/threonine protein kinase